MTAARRHASRGPSRLWPFKARDDIVTIVDLGAQKVACAIVSLTAPRFGLDTGARNVRVLGSAIVRSSGFESGRIVNIAAAETSVRRAVAQAEAEAGITAGDVVVTGQFDGLSAQVFEAKPAAGESAISKEDAAVIWAAAEDECRLAQRKLLHMFTFAAGEPVTPFTAAADAQAEEVDVAAISMPLKGAKQVTACFTRSMLAVRGLIAGPLASALAVTDSLERLAGVLVADLGARLDRICLVLQGRARGHGVHRPGRRSYHQRYCQGFRLAQIRSRTPEDPLWQHLRWPRGRYRFACRERRNRRRHFQIFAQSSYYDRTLR